MVNKTLSTPQKCKRDWWNIGSELSPSVYSLVFNDLRLIRSSVIRNESKNLRISDKWHSKTCHCITRWKHKLFLNFKFSLCSECRMLSSGWFIGLCSLNTKVSEHCLFHLHRRVVMKYILQNYRRRLINQKKPFDQKQFFSLNYMHVDTPDPCYSVKRLWHGK
jgi:hypothetical protein